MSALICWYSGLKVGEALAEAAAEDGPEADPDPAEDGAKIATDGGRELIGVDFTTKVPMASRKTSQVICLI